MTELEKALKDLEETEARNKGLKDEIFELKQMISDQKRELEQHEEKEERAWFNVELLVSCSKCGIAVKTGADGMIRHDCNA